MLPDLSVLDAATWRRLALIWVNHPGNPTGATAPRAFYADLSHWALEDPAGKGVDAVRPIRDEIEQRVRALLASLGVPTVDVTDETAAADR